MKKPRSNPGLFCLVWRACSLHVDDLDPVRAIADRITGRLAQLSTALIDLVDRYTVGLFTRSNQILPGGVDPDATRLCLRCKVGHVGELARPRRNREQRDLVRGALG